MARSISSTRISTIAPTNSSVVVMTGSRSVLPRPSFAILHRHGPRLLPASCVALIVALAGCGGGRTSPVEGVVLLDGQPLAGAAIGFVPQGTGRDATGQTNAKGEFSMSTFEPRDGVVPGEYKVVISPPSGAADTTQYA